MSKLTSEHFKVGSVPVHYSRFQVNGWCQLDNGWRIDVVYPSGGNYQFNQFYGETAMKLRRFLGHWRPENERYFAAVEKELRSRPEQLALFLVT